jgi:hypothetical protein
VAYTFSLVNSGNVKLRGLQAVVPALSGNSSDGSITCIDSTSGNSWTAGSDLAADSSLSCSGSFSFSQDAIEAGDISPAVAATAANLAASVTVDLPVIAVPSTPELLVTLDTSGCTLPQYAGESLNLQPAAYATAASFCCYVSDSMVHLLAQAPLAC